MQSLYDPQDILKILRLPEQAKPTSVFMLLKSLVLPPLDDKIKHLRQGIKRWFFIKTVHPLKISGQ